MITRIVHIERKMLSNVVNKLVESKVHLRCQSYTWHFKSLRALSVSSKVMRDIKRKERLNAESLNDNDGPTSIQIVAMNSGAVRGSKCIYVATESSSYFFNFGDDALRNLLSFGSKYSKRKRSVEAILFTARRWENMSGIITFNKNLQALFCQKAMGKLKLYGTASYNGVIDNLKKLIAFKNEAEDRTTRVEFHLNVISKDEEVLKSKCMSIQPVLLSKYSDKISSYKDADREDVIAYICTFNSSLKRRLSIKKLVEYNVPPGPLMNNLQKGETVILPNGKIINADLVSKYIGDVGKSFLVLELPDESYIDHLLTKKIFEQYQNDNGNDNKLKTIIHLSPYKVLSNKRFIDWLNRFPSSMHHMIINEKGTCVSLPSFEKFHDQMTTLFPELFVTPFHLREPLSSEPAPKYFITGYWIQAKLNLKFRFSPQSHFDESLSPNSLSTMSSNPYDLFLNEIYAEEVQKYPEMKYITGNKNKPYPHVYFLGTSASQLTAAKGTTSILIEITSDKFLMFDCGSGTLGQLMRLFGKDKLDKILMNLHYIFISHRHPDHLFGLNTVLEERTKTFQKYSIQEIPKLVVSGEYKVSSLINILRYDFNSIGNEVVFINNKSLSTKDQGFPQEVFDLKKNLGLKLLKTAVVDHCFQSHGIAIEHHDNWKIVFSGDSSPACKGLIDIGQNCDLLIHEATFEDGLEYEAKRTRHSTTSQAIGVGIRMNAKHVMLTHFSLRYGRVPFIRDPLPSNVGVALDYMKITFSDLPYVCSVFKVIQSQFQSQIAKLHRRDSKNYSKEEEVKPVNQNPYAEESII